MKCVVTGGAGFIGSHLCELLLKEGHEVIAVDNLINGRSSNFDSYKNHPNFSFKEIDILEFVSLRKIVKGSDWVFHLAALADIVPSIEEPRHYYEINVTGTLNVVEACKEAKIKKLLYAASSSCYGIPNKYPTPESTKTFPEYPYALTKYLGEQLILHWSNVYQLPAISLRLFNVYGPRSRTNGTYGAVFGVFLAQKLAGKPYTIVGDGTQSRDFTYVTDVAKAFYKAAKSDLQQGVFNVGSGNHYSINYLVELLQGEKVHIPKRPGEPDCTFADTNAIQEAFNWSPEVSFEEGVEQILQNIDYWKDAPVWDPKSIEGATKAWFASLKEE